MDAHATGSLARRYFLPDSATITLFDQVLNMVEFAQFPYHPSLTTPFPNKSQDVTGHSRLSLGCARSLLAAAQAGPAWPQFLSVEAPIEVIVTKDDLSGYDPQSTYGAIALE